MKSRTILGALILALFLALAATASADCKTYGGASVATGKVTVLQEWRCDEDGGFTCTNLGGCGTANYGDRRPGADGRGGGSLTTVWQPQPVVQKQPILVYPGLGCCDCSGQDWYTRSGVAPISGCRCVGSNWWWNPATSTYFRGAAVCWYQPQ